MTHDLFTLVALTKAASQPLGHGADGLTAEIAELLARPASPAPHPRGVDTADNVVIFPGRARGARKRPSHS